MKNYVRPEIEVLSLQTESVMLDTFDLGASNVSGGFGERD